MGWSLGRKTSSTEDVAAQLERVVAAVRASFSVENAAASNITVVEQEENDCMRRMMAVAQLLEAGRYVDCIHAAQVLLAEEPTTRATCENLIGASYFHLKRYPEAVRFYAAMARSQLHIPTALACVNEVLEVLHIDVSPRRLVRAALAAGCLEEPLLQTQREDNPRMMVLLLLAFDELFRRHGVSQLSIQPLLACIELDPLNAYAKLRLTCAAAAAGHADASRLQATLPPVALPERLRAAMDPFLAEAEQVVSARFGELLEHFPR